MSSRRTLILVAAVAIGAVAAFLVLGYVRGVEDRVHADAERVPVLRVVDDVPKGTAGETALQQGLIELAEIPAEFRPASAVVDPAQLGGLVATTDLAADQLVVAGLFVAPADAVSTFAGLLDAEEVAVTVSVDQVRGVAGLLVPGDHVNLLVVSDAVGPEPAPGQSAHAAYTQPARYLYQKVRILAVGQDRLTQPGEASGEEASAADSSSTGLITFAVPPEAAQRIASAGAQLYLTLVSPDYEPRTLPPIDLGQPLPGENGGVLTPYGPDGRVEP